MPIALLSFIAGVLTVLSPCTFTLLPVILTGSLTNKSLLRPLVISISLGISIILFTLLLKVSSIFINVSPEALTAFSGILLIGYGLTNLFPEVWAKIEIKLGFSETSSKLMQKSSSKGGILGSILIGVSLGPVFASCSPTYAIIIATVLPANLTLGTFYLFLYALGLVSFLLLISVLGQKFIQKFKFSINPNGIFKKILGVVFILIGLLILTGFDKTLQTKLGFLDATKIETRLFNKDTKGMLFNISNPYKAPELAGITDTFNAENINLADLKGKVVIIDFWTYSCINCIRSTPYLNDWYEKYKDKGLVIIGVHAPEFQFEKDPSNVEKAIKDAKIKYPVVMDNDFKTWRAYKNQYWPAKYFIDREGKVRHTHFGEGEYDESEEVIRQLLLEGNASLFDVENTKVNNVVPIRVDQSPETYLGYARISNQFKNKAEKINDEEVKYSYSKSLNKNEWELDGSWIITEEEIKSVKDSKLKINFSAKNVYLVMGSESEATIEVTLNSEKISLMEGTDLDSESSLKVSDNKLYKLVNLPEFKSNQVLELKVTNGEVNMNAFTFGGL